MTDPMNNESMNETNPISQDVRSKILDFKYDIITKISDDDNN
jgi:hypothetical protein